MLELSDAPIPRDMQGESWVPLLDQRNAPWREDFLYEYYEYPGVHCVRPHRGIRTSRWKLLEFWRQPREYELYDLAADPDVAGKVAPEILDAAMNSHAHLRSVDDRFRLVFGEAGPAPI